jgi:hypothetical protein
MKFSIILFLILLLCLSFNEGFETDNPYSYLEPHPITVLDPLIEANFTSTFNKVNAAYPKIVPIHSQDVTIFKTFATVEEFNYYLKNNKWPYGSYLIDYVTHHDVLLDAFSPIIPNVDTIQKAFPSRFVYASIKETEINTESYKIFMG